jgi:hypothetical protein
MDYLHFIVASGSEIIIGNGGLSFFRFVTNYLLD